MFSAVNSSNTMFITAAELSHLLTHTIGHKFSIPQCRMIMKEVDIDGDGELCMLDLLSLFYLSEVYLIGMAGKLSDLRALTYA